MCWTCWVVTRETRDRVREQYGIMPPGDLDSRHARRGEVRGNSGERGSKASKSSQVKVSCWMPTPDSCSMMMIVVLDPRVRSLMNDDDDGYGEGMTADRGRRVSKTLLAIIIPPQ